MTKIIENVQVEGEILRRFFCLYSTGGTNSEAETPAGSVRLLKLELNVSEQ